VIDMETHFEKQDASAPLRDPVIRDAIRLLELPEGSSGLDAGCGIGNHALRLADAVGPDGHVTGLELLADFVTHAKNLAESSGLSDRISIRQGDVNDMPFADNAFDWAWSVDCVGHVSIGEPLAGLREMARVVRPGGRVALLGYSSQMLLPGHPRLEARLNATASAMTFLCDGQPPTTHFPLALGWFREAGFQDCAARTVVRTVHSPLDKGVRRALISLFGMLWGGLRGNMSATDREEFLRLTEQDSDDCVLDHPDYYAYFTYAVFDGKVAAKEVRVV
jgi:demethylmenaquinone methyltransferase/2-methoxy-6-polyprenyl-1,4-benzoquinol methylase